MTRIGPILLLLLGLGPTVAGAQGYRVRLDAGGQAVSYRGLTPDSISATEVVPAPSGGVMTLDGFGVRCTGGPYCYYYRPGPIIRSLPMSAAISTTVWGFGPRGLSFGADARVVGDPSDEGGWPGTEPTLQLLEAYAEYERGWWSARGGRLLLSSRLTPVGFDGALARGRTNDGRFEATAYGGWGLGQAAVVPLSSPTLNPLDEWRPADRQILLGARAGWRATNADLDLEYRRETDPATGEYVSERGALSFEVRQFGGFRLSGGAEYNIAEDVLGSADLTLTHLGRSLTVTAGGRRYRPYFSLWTLWGAFSPVPYHALMGSVDLRPAEWISLRGRGELYRFDAAEAGSPNVTLEDRGWRASMGVHLVPLARVGLDLDYSADFGPGAASRALTASATWYPTDAVTLSGYGGALERPLELRFYDAEGVWIGGRGEIRLLDSWRFWGDLSWSNEERNRPDAGANEFDQWRIRAGITITFGSNPDRFSLPPGRPRQP